MKQYQKNTFFSAVNRIPRYPEQASDKDKDRNDEIYTSGNTPHLDHLHVGRMSGYFDLKLQAHTPLIIGKQTEQGKKRVIEVQKIERKPFISPSMIKGLLSSTYERVTSSRFRIFDTLPTARHLSIAQENAARDTHIHHTKSPSPPRFNQHKVTMRHPLPKGSSALLAKRKLPEQHYADD